MKYGKKIIMSDQGFHIDSRLLQAVGIRNNSRCRGVFISDYHQEGGVNKNENKDLIIPPFPFSSWGCTVKLQLRLLKESINGLETVLKILKDNGFNILSINFTSGGYKHNAFDVAGELFELRQYVKEIRDQEGNKEKLKQEFKIRLYDKIQILDGLIKEQCEDYLYHSNDDDNLADTDIENYIATHNKTIKISLKNFKKIDLKQKINPVSWQWSKALALNAFHTENGEERLYFNFDLKNALLSLENKKATNMFLQRFGQIPTVVLVTFDTGNGYIRIRKFSKVEYNKQVFQFDFSYAISIVEMNNEKIKAVNEYGSRGIILKLLESIKTKMTSENKETFEITGINTKQLSRMSTRHEEGVIGIHGIFTTKDKSPIKAKELENISEDICNDIRKDKNPPSNQIMYQSDVSIKEVSPYTIFISVRENFKDRVTCDIAKVLKKESFHTITSETYTTEITKNVIQDMSFCDACIQIYTLSIEETNKAKCEGEKAKFNPDASWLLYEFGVASANGIPVVRLIDVSYFYKKQWLQYLRTDNDKLLIEFNNNIKEMSLKTKIKEASKQLLKALKEKYKI